MIISGRDLKRFSEILKGGGLKPLQTDTIITIIYKTVFGDYNYWFIIDPGSVTEFICLNFRKIMGF